MAKKLDTQAFGSGSMSQRDTMAKSMGLAPGSKAKPKVNVGPWTNTTIGGKPVNKMSPAKIAARKKTTISNAASKHMGGLYSK